MGSASTAAASAPSPALEVGRRLFLLHCAECHGESGDGYGMRHDISYARPRSFQSARFKLSTTENQVPSDADLVRTISQGMPGSGMPNWGWLGQEEIAALAAYVRSIGVDALRTDLAAEVAAGKLSSQEAEERLIERTVPGPPVTVPPEPPVTAVGLRRGAEIYAQACAACHGADGEARMGEVKSDFEGNRLVPTSLRAGVFKGGSESGQLYVRLLKGLDGTAMPGYEEAYGAEDLWHLVHYVQSLSAPGAPVVATLASEGVAGGASVSETGPSGPGAGDRDAETADRAPDGAGDSAAGARGLSLLVIGSIVGLALLLLVLGLGSASR